jgi:hypothetical protein
MIFIGFLYEFRAGRRFHDDLDALAVAIMKVNCIIDADIQGFFPPTFDIVSRAEILASPEYLSLSKNG